MNGSRMEAEDCSPGCSSFSLMCQEDSTDLDDDFTDGGGGGGGGKMLLLYDATDGEEDDEEEYMDHLVSKESSSLCSSPESSLSCSSSAAAAESSPSMASEDWFLCARRATVKWILETRGHFGFCHRTAYLAISYFDRFCLRRCFDKSVMPWASRLLAVACVSLAAKMEEYRAPVLPEFRADDDEYEFSCVSIRRMELLVLSTLGWRMGAVTPFDYLPCLSSRLRRGNGGSGGTLVAVKAAALIFSAAEVASVVDYRPSTVAVAAVLAAAHGALTKDTLGSKMSSLSPSCLLEKEDVYACYTMMLTDSPSPSPPPPQTTTATNRIAKRSASYSVVDATSTYDSSFDAAAFSVAAAAAAATMSNNKRVRLDLPGIHR